MCFIHYTFSLHYSSPVCCCSPIQYSQYQPRIPDLVEFIFDMKDLKLMMHPMIGIFHSWEPRHARDNLFLPNFRCYLPLFSALFHYVKAKANNGEHLAASPPSETNNQNTVSLMVLNTREGSCTLSGTGTGVYSFALDNMAQGRRMYWQIQSIICFECCMCTGKQLNPIDSWPLNVRVCNCNLQVLQGVRLVVARMSLFLCVRRRAIMQLLLQFL